MAKLTDEQKRQLDELTALANAPDDEDFEIEIRNGERSARVPYHKGRAYLQEHFGIDLDPPRDDGNGTDDGTQGDPPPDDKDTRVSGRYFGPKKSA